MLWLGNYNNGKKIKLPVYELQSKAQVDEKLKKDSIGNHTFIQPPFSLKLRYQIQHGSSKEIGSNYARPLQST